MQNTIISKGRVAVITGAAMGIGAAAARRFAAAGMRLALLDRDEAALRALAADLDTETRLVVGDVILPDDLQRLHDTAYGAFGETALLLNNAGISRGAAPWQDMAGRRRQMEVNFFAIVQAQILFVPSMLKQSQPSAVVNLGSKEGITTPPGNAAYSVAKAGVKVLTEQLAHELRQLPGHQVSAHLFVPGYTWTPMNGRQPGQTDADKKPSMWTAAQLLDYFVPRFENGDFYILCPDNDVDAHLDARRIQWSADDMMQNRPALSRWHPDWKDKFAQFIKE